MRRSSPSTRDEPARDRRLATFLGVVIFNGLQLGEIRPPYDVPPGQAIAQAVGADPDRCAMNVTAEELEECLVVKVILNEEGGRLILDSRGV